MTCDQYEVGMGEYQLRSGEGQARKMYLGFLISVLLSYGNMPTGL
jgi:hypothetical protein